MPWNFLERESSDDSSEQSDSIKFLLAKGERFFGMWGAALGMLSVSPDLDLDTGPLSSFFPQAPSCSTGEREESSEHICWTLLDDNAARKERSSSEGNLMGLKFQAVIYFFDHSFTIKDHLKLLNQKFLCSVKAACVWDSCDCEA